MQELQPIRTNIIYGEQNRSDSLKAYKAESELKKAIKTNKNSLEVYLKEKYEIPIVFKIKNYENDEKEEYSLLDIINSKLTNSNIATCLNTYEIYKEYGIERAIETLHLQSNLTII
jgi:predicted nucleotide-binding protein (sugar kinase/HSP70/actin superfamily)